MFENEIHDLFGVSVRDIAIDFGGNFYVTAQPSPMTIISPAQKAARENQEGGGSQGQGCARQAAAANASFVVHPDAKGKVSGVAPSADVEDIELKMAGADRRSPASRPRARRAKAKRAEAEAQAARPQVYDEALEAKLAAMDDPEKAAKGACGYGRRPSFRAWSPKAQAVRGALANEAKMESQGPPAEPRPNSRPSSTPSSPSSIPKAAKVRAALDARARRETARAEHDEKVAVLEGRLKNMDPERQPRCAPRSRRKQRQAQRKTEGW